MQVATLSSIGIHFISTGSVYIRYGFKPTSSLIIQ